MANILPGNAAEKMKANEFFTIWEKGKLKFGKSFVVLENISERTW